MINITLPDGTKQKYDTDVNGLDIARSIGPKL